METYSYPTESTANERVNPVVLQDQILAVSLPTEGVVVQDAERAGNGCFETGRIDVLFAVPLTTAEQAALDQVVSAHVGKPTLATIFRVSVALVGMEHEVTDPTGWEDVGGTVTSPDYFVANLSLAFARVVGQYRAVDDGAVARLVENEGATERVVSAEVALPDTGGVWTRLPSFNTNAPPSAGQNLYRLQAKLDVATALAFRFVGVSLLELDA